MRRIVAAFVFVAALSMLASTPTPAVAATTPWIISVVPNGDRLSDVATADGNPLVSYAVSENVYYSDRSTDNGRVFATTDGGLSWDLLNVTLSAMMGVDTSTNGATVVIIGGDGPDPDARTPTLLRSSNHGATWATVGPALATHEMFTDVAMSSDGSVVAVASSAGTFVSTNFLSDPPTWNGPIAGNAAERLAMNATGTVIWGATLGGDVVKSIDFGVTWASQSALPPLDWQGIATSADGQRVIVISRNFENATDLGFYSVDGGTTWSTSSALMPGLVVDQQVSVDMSPDGSTVVATSYYGEIMLSRDGGSSFELISLGTGSVGDINSFMSLSVSNPVNGVDRFTVVTEIDGIITRMPTPPPLIGSVSELTGPSSGGTRVSLTGSFLYEVQSVTFGGVAGTDLTRISATSIEVTTPPRPVGTANLVVTTDYGSFTFPDPFVYTGSPATSDSPLPVIVTPPTTAAPPTTIAMPNARPTPSDLRINDLANVTAFIDPALTTPGSLRIVVDLEQLPSSAPTIGDSPTVRHRAVSGTRFAITVTNARPREPFVVSLHSDPVVLTQASADEQGTLQTTVQLPLGMTGEHTLVVYGPESERGFAMPLSITPLQLPATGSTDSLMDLALWLAAAGAGVTLTHRSRRAVRS